MNINPIPMKIKLLIIAAAVTVLSACASPEERATDQIDTTENHSMNDSTSTDTITATGSMSGDNGAGADTMDTKRQKATREAGNR